jgi:hypothetical protein
VKIFAIFFLFIFLIKEPFQIYLIFGDGYKILYSVAVIFTLLFFQKIRRSKILALYVIYVLLMLTVFNISLFFGSYDLNLMLSIQFLASLALFFVLYILASKIKNPLKILSVINSLAVILSVFSLIIMLLLLLDWDIFMIITFFPENGREGMLFMLPFGFLHNPFDFGITGYRSYGYASEPAKLAFFLVPFVFYNYHYFSITKLKKYLVYSIVVFLVVVSTRSTAAFITLLFSTFFYFWLVNKINLKFFMLILAITVTFVSVSVSVFVLDDFFYINYLSYVNRIYEWTYAIQGIFNNIFGIGLGNGYEETLVFDENIRQIRSYTTATNVLNLLVSLGVLALAPLVFFGVILFIVMKKLVEDNTSLSNLLAVFLFSSSFFLISINMIFSPIYLFYIALSIYYLGGHKECRV